MPINSCPIASSSVNTFCRGRRQVVIDNLIPLLRSPVVGGVGRPGREWEGQDFHTFKPTELEAILVTVEFNGIKMRDYQEVKSDNTLIFLTGLISNDAPIDVNINNLMINNSGE
jgi:hypothetical protein